MARGGAIFADGEQLDIDVPVVTADFVGNALIDGPDYLAFVALANGPWSLAEMRRDGDLRTRIAPGQSWQAGAVVDAAGLRLSDALANASAATPVAAPAGQDGHWYALQTSFDMGPGIMWDNTRDLFPVLRDADAELFIEVADDGTPVAACLKQSWWQGMDDLFGEEASMMSAVRFTRVGSAPPLPPVSWPSEREQASALDMELPVPQGGESKWDGEIFWVWLDDEDELPRLCVTRSRIPDETLGYLRELPVEQVLELMAQNDAASAKAGWNRDPSTVEPARIGGTDGEARSLRACLHSTPTSMASVPSSRSTSWPTWIPGSITSNTWPRSTTSSRTATSSSAPSRACVSCARLTVAMPVPRLWTDTGSRSHETWVAVTQPIAWTRRPEALAASLGKPLAETLDWFRRAPGTE